jgi:hypothetical protein
LETRTSPRAGRLEGQRPNENLALDSEVPLGDPHNELSAKPLRALEFVLDVFDQFLKALNRDGMLAIEQDATRSPNIGSAIRCLYAAHKGFPIGVCGKDYGSLRLRRG